MSLELPYNIKIVNASSDVDELYGPYDSLQQALDSIPASLRKVGKTFAVKTTKGVVEYWWKHNVQNSDAIVKFKTIQIKVNDETVVDNDGEFSFTLNSENTTHNDAISNLGVSNVKGAIEKIVTLIKGLANIQFKIVDTLPAQGESNIIYLKKSTKQKQGNKKEEWIWVDNAWELIGSTEVDLTEYAKLGAYTGTISELKTELENSLNNKVDKIHNKGLSTNDYTTQEKTKLANIAENAEMNVQSDWNETNTNSDSYIKNKPSRLQLYTDEFHMPGTNIVNISHQNYIFIGAFVNGVLLPERAYTLNASSIQFDVTKFPSAVISTTDVITIKYLY